MYIWVEAAQSAILTAVTEAGSNRPAGIGIVKMGTRMIFEDVCIYIVAPENNDNGK